MHTFTVERSENDHHTITIIEGLSVSQHLFANGLSPDGPLCSGLGRCGRCKVRYSTQAPNPLNAEYKKIPTEELSSGVRLACLRPPVPGEHIALLQTVVDKNKKPLTTKLCGKPCKLAVDLGTTSMQWALTDETAAVITSGSLLNPQQGAGSEVMSRLHFAQTGQADILQDRIHKTLKAICEECSPHPIDEIILSANPAMTALALGKPYEGLCRAPYTLDYPGGQQEVIWPDLPPIYTPPQLAPFVGGDISAGLLHILQSSPEYPFLLADLGTNGEFVLGLSQDKYLIASVPMGPSLEGVGMTCGSMARPGVAVGFEASPAGIAALPYDASGNICSISGTGYLSLIALLLQAGLLSEQGLFIEPTTPLGKRLATYVQSEGEKQLILPHNLFLSATDVEELLKVKAAFNWAVAALCKAAELSAASLKAIHIAGALGQHVPHSALTALGFLPRGTESLIKVAGNSSLAGSRLLAYDSSSRKIIATLAKSVNLLELTAGPDADKQFITRMVFQYVH